MGGRTLICGERHGYVVRPRMDCEGCLLPSDRQWRKKQRMASAMPRAPTYRQTARDLAAAHRKVDPATETILLIPDPREEEIRLIEVSTRAPWSGDVLPFRFEARPDLDVPFPSVVVLLHPREWEDVKNKRLALPEGWDLSTCEEL